MRWLKNTEGRRDAVLTMTWIGFLIVAVKVLFSGATIAVADNSFSLGQIDAGVIAAILTPTLGAYVARRYTDKRHSLAVTSDVDTGG